VTTSTESGMRNLTGIMGARARRRGPATATNFGLARYPAELEEWRGAAALPDAAPPRVALPGLPLRDDYLLMAHVPAAAAAAPACDPVAPVAAAPGGARRAQSGVIGEVCLLRHASAWPDRSLVQLQPVLIEGTARLAAGARRSAGPPACSIAGPRAAPTRPAGQRCNRKP